MEKYMGIYANGQLIYGFVNDGDAKDVFTAIKEKWEEQEGEDESACFEEMHEELQEKHNITLRSVGYNSDVDILCAYEASASAKNITYETIASADLAKTETYAGNIKQFLEALGIDASKCQPGWHILAYMD